MMSQSPAQSEHTVCDHETGPIMVDVKDPEAGEQTSEEEHRAEKDTGESNSDEKDAVDVEKAGAPAGDEAASDPNVVDWDGPDDPANPRNWSKVHKMTNVALISLSVLYCSLATTMFAPGANIMQREFGFTSPTVEVLTITIASLGFALGQLFVGPASEVWGRLPVYHTSAVFYLGFTAGCARSTHIAEFLIFRLLTGVAAASYMSTGGGTIADVLPKEERGAAMAFYTSGPLFGPVIGPIVGGFVTENLGWRWTFYLVLLIAGTVTVASFILMHETSAVVLLKAKAARLRKETGNPNLRAAGDKQTPMKHLVAHALTRPIRFLVMSPIVLLIALYVAFVFGLTMLLFATFPTIYEEQYGWSVGLSGLSYLGIGFGCAIGVFVFAKYSDRLLRSKDGKHRPERRLIMMMYSSPLLPIGMFIYGWTTQYKVHWIVPMIATAIGGPGAVILTGSSQTYIIDVFGPQAAASAVGAITLVRNLMGTFLPLAAPGLYASLGLGWGNSLLGFLFVLFIPVPFFFYWRGEWLRERFPVKI